MTRVGQPGIGGGSRERFVRSGFDGFAEHEIVELLLTLAIPRSDVKEPAKALLRRFGSVRGVMDAPSGGDAAGGGDRVGGPGGAGDHPGRRGALPPEQANERASVLGDRARIRDFWRMRIGSLTNEVFEVAYLDSGASGAAERRGEAPARDSGPGVRLPPARWWRRRCGGGAAAIVLAHNHPNGRVEPSEADKLTTRAIVLAAETIRLRVVDHLIVSADEAFSFREAGLL